MVPTLVAVSRDNEQARIDDQIEFYREQVRQQPPDWDDPEVQALVRAYFEDPRCATSCAPTARRMIDAWSSRPAPAESRAPCSRCARGSPRSTRASRCTTSTARCMVTTGSTTSSRISSSTGPTVRTT